MRKRRNPRYAPEALERKLSPSAMVGGFDPSAMYATAPSGPSDPPRPDPNAPPDLPPFNPYGPTGPA